MRSLKMHVKHLIISVVLLASDLLESAHSKCFYTECIIFTKHKCPDGYMAQSSQPCVFGLFGHSYLCCTTEEATTTVASTSSLATTPGGPTTTTKGTPSVLNCEKVKQSELPFVVALQRSSNLTSYHFCDGCILSPRWVLTSGRCLFDDNKKPLQANGIIVTAASLDLQALEGTEQIVIADQFYIHPSYNVNNVTQYANLALLHLAQPLEFNEYVSRIDLPPAQFDTNTLSNGVIAGWKINDLCASSNASSLLQKVRVPTVDDKTCSQIYTSQVDPKGQIKTDGDSQICTVGNNQYNDCPAYAGGFLQCEPYVCGIVSLIAPEGSINFPNIYTDITFFRDFVEKTMNS